jgi:hypothetical protein
MIPGVLFATDEQLKLDIEKFHADLAVSHATGAAQGHVLRAEWARHAVGTSNAAHKTSSSDRRRRGTGITAVLIGVRSTTR